MLGLAVQVGRSLLLLVQNVRRAQPMLRAIVLVSRKKTTSDTEKCNGTVIQVGIPIPKLSQDLHSPSPWTHTQMSSQQLLFTSVAIFSFEVVIFTFIQLTCAQ